MEKQLLRRMKNRPHVFKRYCGMTIHSRIAEKSLIMDMLSYQMAYNYLASISVPPKVCRWSFDMEKEFPLDRNPNNYEVVEPQIYQN